MKLKLVLVNNHLLICAPFQNLVNKLMCVFSKKGMIAGLVILLFSMSANASPFMSSKKSFIMKSQMEQLEEVYKILMGTRTNQKQAQIKAAFSPSNNKTYSKRLRVTATAYTSHVGQTDSTPNIAAWGDRLYPGMKSIAVSRDLLKVYGLKHKQKVRIKGLKGEYVVLDKMNKRWRKKIDIYMGKNKRNAFKWGRRKVEIFWD